METSQNHIVESAVLLKSLGHPIRLRIIISLSENTLMTVTQLSHDLGVDQPVMSLHLAILRKQDIIKVKKEGKTSLYSIADISIKQIVNLVYHTRK